MLRSLISSVIPISNKKYNEIYFWKKVKCVKVLCSCSSEYIYLSSKLKKKQLIAIFPFKVTETLLKKNFFFKQTSRITFFVDRENTHHILLLVISFPFLKKKIMIKYNKMTLFSTLFCH